MKNIALLLMLAFFINSIASSRSRQNDSVGLAFLPDGIYFGDQAEIDNFQTNHPNCTEIEGDVTISDFWQAKRWLWGGGC